MVLRMRTNQKICDEDLITKTKRLVAEERMKTVEIIEHLQEIYDRRLHLTRGYPSLHEFLVRELGYSDGAAHRRISAMRLVHDVPEAKQSIAEGKLSLTTASQVQSFFRAESQKRQKTYSKAEKLELLETVEGTSREQCERKLAETSPQYAVKSKLPGIEQDDELALLLEEFRQLAMLSDGSPLNIIKSALRQAIERLKAKSQKAAETKFTASCKVSQASPAKLPSRYIPSTIKSEIWRRDKGRCTYIDPRTKRRCEATYHLEFDHITPFSLDGETSVGNLRLLCKAHNQLRAILTFGIPKIAALKPGSTP